MVDIHQSADPSAMVSIATEHLMAHAIALACKQHGIDYRELLQRARQPIDDKEGLGIDGANVLSEAASIATDILWQSGYFDAFNEEQRQQRDNLIDLESYRKED